MWIFNPEHYKEDPGSFEEYPFWCYFAAPLFYVLMHCYYKDETNFWIVLAVFTTLVLLVWKLVKWWRMPDNDEEDTQL